MKLTADRKVFIFYTFSLILKTSGISGMQKESGTYCLMPNKALSKKCLKQFYGYQFACHMHIPVYCSTIELVYIGSP